MRTINDFGKIHDAWMKTMMASGQLPPPIPYTGFPIDMTREEFDKLRYTWIKDNKQTITLFGHPIRITPAPAATIPTPYDA